MGSVKSLLGNPSLDIREQKSHAEAGVYLDQKEVIAEWKKKQLAEKRRRRSFHRALSGLQAHQRGLVFLTLTTSPEAVEAGKDIHSSFRALMMRLKRRWPSCAYMRVVEYTKAGRPHLHVLLAGLPRIPQATWSRLWRDIHLSPIVWIVKVGSATGAAGYLAKYLGKDPRARYSWSWGWVWRGFVKDWERIKRRIYRAGGSLEQAINQWAALLDTFHDLLYAGGVCYAGATTTKPRRL